MADAAFMVAPTKAGGGLGRWMAELVLDEARSAGYTAVQCNGSFRSTAERLFSTRLDGVLNRA